MMNSVMASRAVCIVFLGLLGQAVCQSTSRCSLLLRNGGYCVNKRENCPQGTFEFPMYSNYIGCFRMDQKCCAGDSSTPTKNPDASLPPQPRNCGIGSLNPSDRILDGILTGQCDWPFVVSIRAQLQSQTALDYQSTSHACQGVLIDPEWVLTSPFCILSAAGTAAEAPSRILVIAGEYNVAKIDINPFNGQQQEQVINVERVIFHPNYKYTSQQQILPFNDTVGLNSDGVALIKLTQRINGRCSGIACLPTESEAANQCAVYDECVITGWGFSTENFNQGLEDELLYGLVRLSSPEACDFLTERLGLTSNRPTGTICQSPLNRNTDGCLGDEGGAVMCSNGNNWVVRGILPFNMCANGRYNLYVTEVAPYLDWIMENIGSTSSSGTGGQTRNF